MPIVSLNLDLDDASVVRRALAGALAACRCQEAVGPRSCADCEAIWALMSELDRVLRRSAGWPAGRCVDGAAALATGGVDAPAAVATRRLWPVPAGPDG